ncbi:hypothetical protein V8G54_025710 [Vigna mungo]|uniref:Signal peptidase complex catalytic subunit SEC11 n=1 Tax=Vigna mungo TaxID=3915 RepID=A0AAQ3RPT5_VIGMU
MRGRKQKEELRLKLGLGSSHRRLVHSALKRREEEKKQQQWVGSERLWIPSNLFRSGRFSLRLLASQSILCFDSGMIVTSALIIWKALMCITGSESPVVVVLSGSMEPGFKRGDILFLHMSKDPIRAGEIVVFNVDGREIPIVHRVIKVSTSGTPKLSFKWKVRENLFTALHGGSTS